MNKQVRYLFSFLLSIVLGLTACTEQGEVDKILQPQGDNEVTFSLDGVKTRAVGDETKITATPALEREKKVTELYAVVYEAENALFYQTVQCMGTGTENQYKFDMKRAGKFFFYLVANPDAALKDALMAGPVTEEDLFKVVAKQTPGEDATADHFLMSSGKVSVTTVAKTPQTLAAPIKMTRFAARFDFYNRVEGLQITKITFKNRYVESRFAPSLKMDGLQHTSDKSYAFSGNECIATVYGYENANRSETVFVLEGTFNGKAVKPYEVVLKNLAIKRNYLYTIIINPDEAGVEPGTPDVPGQPNKFGNVKFNIIVNDWNEAQTLTWKDGQLLQPLKVYSKVKAINGLGILANYIDENSEEIETATLKPGTTVSVMVTSYIKPGKLAIAEGENYGSEVAIAPQGNAQKTVDGKYEQMFTVTLSPTLQPNEYKSYKLSVINGTGTATLPLTIKHGRPKMPLECVAEFDLAQEDEHNIANFATYKFDAPEASQVKPGYFSRNRMNTVFEASKSTTLKGYHIPGSMYEWLSILPFYYQGKGGVVGRNALAGNNWWEWIVLPWRSAERKIELFQADYRPSPFPAENTDKETVTYGLRYKACSSDGNGNDGYLLTAYRFKVVHKQEPDGMGGIIVTSTYLGKQFNNGKIEEILNEDFWKKSETVVRTFPMNGVDNSTGSDTNLLTSIEDVGIQLDLWTTGVFKTDNSYNEMFSCDDNKNKFGSNFKGYHKIGRTVRLFTDE